MSDYRIQIDEGVLREVSLSDCERIAEGPWVKIFLLIDTVSPYEVSGRVNHGACLVPKMEANHLRIAEGLDRFAVRSFASRHLLRSEEQKNPPNCPPTSVFWVLKMKFIAKLFAVYSRR